MRVLRDFSIVATFATFQHISQFCASFLHNKLSSICSHETVFCFNVCKISLDRSRVFDIFTTTFSSFFDNLPAKNVLSNFFPLNDYEYHMQPKAPTLHHETTSCPSIGLDNHIFLLPVVFDSLLL